MMGTNGTGGNGPPPFPDGGDFAQTVLLQWLSFNSNSIRYSRWLAV